MVKRILLASAALVASPALAFPQPPDVAAYSAVTPTYKTDNSVNTVIDSTVTPMPIGTGLTNIPIPSTTNRIITNGPYSGTTAPFKTTIPYGGTGSENKFRTIVDFSHMLPDDPIRNYGQPGTSHLHCFFGSGSTNAKSTYKTLRKHALNSTAAGTDVNATGYWYPCPVVLNPYGDGKNFAIKADEIIVYYTENPATDGTGANAKAFIPVGLRYVFGFEMDAASVATQYAWLQTALDTANTAHGSVRYTLTDPAGHYQTQALYNCIGASPGTAYVLKTAAGADPYGGTCASGAQFFIKIEGSMCYDGTNLWAPGGYKNFIPGVWDNVTNGWACPYNYYKLPSLSLEIIITQYGWTDRQRWDLSSDIAYRAAHSLTTATLPPGSTFHTDWNDGWDHVQMNKWQVSIGVEHNTGHELDSSQIDDSHYLKGGLSNENGVSRVPQVTPGSLAHVLETDPGWMLIPPAWSGSLTNMHIHN